METTRYMFFTGKGGVGKTSLACATAIGLADAGAKVLLVSTDPASNLDDVLAAKIGTHPTEIPGVTRLWALNLEPEETAKAYRERVVGPYRGVLPETAIASMEEQLAGACTMEIATFELFTRFLDDADRAAGYGRIIFDTAPTGHTLRLLALPRAWSGFLNTNTSGASCIGPLAGLGEERVRFENAVCVLANDTLTTLVLVTRPETTSLVEAARASREFGELGVASQQLLVNGVLATNSKDPMAEAFRRQQADAIESMPPELRRLPRRSASLAPVPPMGIDGLRLLSQNMERGTADLRFGPEEIKVTRGYELVRPNASRMPVGLRPVVDDLASREHGVVLVMGKGGVGKTTVAAALALALVERGRHVHLSTTDPAAHLDLALAGADRETGTRFTVSHIDQEAEVKAYRDEVMSTAGADLDEDGRALLAEDLASPCTEEVAVFRAFARTVDRVEDGFVVLDTAPTGHTLLLLDATQSYHRQLQQNSSGEIPLEVQQLLPRLRDPVLTHVLIVTLAQTTPVHEAAHLQNELRRAGIEPSWWVVNQTWTGVPTQDPVLSSLARTEAPWLDRVSMTLAKRVVRIPWQARVPKGRDGLAQLLHDSRLGANT